MSMDEEKKKLEENKFNENDKRIKTELKVRFYDQNAYFLIVIEFFFEISGNDQ